MSAIPLTKAQQAVRDAIAAGVDAFREAFHNTRDYDAGEPDRGGTGREGAQAPPPAQEGGA